MKYKYFKIFRSFLIILFFANFNSYGSNPKGAFTESQLFSTTYHYFNQFLFNLNEKDISKVVEEARFHASQNKLNEKSVLEKLIKGITKEVSYHSTRTMNQYDNQSIIAGATLLGISILGFTLLYKAYKKWHKPIKDRINEFNKKYNIKKTRHLDNMIYISGAGTQNEELANLMNKSARYFVAEQFGFILLCLAPFINGYKKLAYGLNPQHLKNFEQFSLIKKILELALITPRKNIIFT